MCCAGGSDRECAASSGSRARCPPAWAAGRSWTRSFRSRTWSSWSSASGSGRCGEWSRRWPANRSRRCPRIRARTPGSSRSSSYAGVGAEARRYLEAYVRGLDVRERKRTAEELLQFEAIVARAEGGVDEAIRALERAVRESACPGCVLPELALTYRMAGQADAAIAAYERYLVTPWLMRLFQDAIWLPIAHATLAELYEEKGDVVRAAAHYARLAELWADADPELQPRVESARLAAARLAGESTGAGGASLPR